MKEERICTMVRTWKCCRETDHDTILMTSNRHPRKASNALKFHLYQSTISSLTSSFLLVSRDCQRKRWRKIRQQTSLPIRILSKPDRLTQVRGLGPLDLPEKKLYFIKSWRDRIPYFFFNYESFPSFSSRPSQTTLCYYCRNDYHNIELKDRVKFCQIYRYL